MRNKLFFLAVLLSPAWAQAQLAAPLRVLSEGSGLAIRFKLNFTGAGVSCVDNAGAVRTDCTIAGASANSLTGNPSATGDLVYSTSGTTAMSRLADVATGSVLASGGVGAAPVWASTLSGLTLSAPVISGLTSSGPTAINFGGSSGDFTLSTGALSWSGASGKGASLTSGTTMAGSANAFDFLTTSTPTSGDSIFRVRPNGSTWLTFGLIGAGSFTGVRGLDLNSLGAIGNSLTSAPNAFYFHGGVIDVWVNGTSAWQYSNGDLSPQVSLSGSVGNNQALSAVGARHYIGAGTAPGGSTPPANVQFGASPTISIAGHDGGFVVTLVTGTGPTVFVGGTKVAVSTVTFNSAYPAAPAAITCSPANDKAAAAQSGATGVVFFADTYAAGTFVLEAVDSGTGTLTASTTYLFSCHVDG